MPLSSFAFQRCISPSCAATYGVEQVLTSCAKCGSLLDVAYEWDRIPLPKRLRDFEQFWSARHEPRRFSGVWRFHELLQFSAAEDIVTIGEGQTLLQKADFVAEFVGMNPGNLFLPSALQG